MMIQEFEKLTGIYPTADLYAVIEAAYMEFDGDKTAFCKAYKSNKNGIAEKIQREANMAADVIGKLASFVSEAWDTIATACAPPKWRPTPSGPESARSTATASGGRSSLRWHRKEVGARDSQVRRLRPSLECEPIRQDPKVGLHLPAL